MNEEAFIECVRLGMTGCGYYLGWKIHLGYLLSVLAVAGMLKYLHRAWSSRE